jgi:hypothetical protein
MPARAVDVESASQHFDAFSQACETGSILGIGASDAVVLDGHCEKSAAP